MAGSSKTPGELQRDALAVVLKNVVRWINNDGTDFSLIFWSDRVHWLERSGDVAAARTLLAEIEKEKA